jgi:two-component system, sensor histidine kinase ChiS
MMHQYCPASGRKAVTAFCALILLAILMLSACSETTSAIPSSAPNAPEQPGADLASLRKVITTRPRRDNDIQFTNLSLDQGLSQSVVTAICQDSQGFLWLGTQDGLNRYDGYNFRVFKNDPVDPNSLSDNYVYAILEDSQGYLWVGTNGGLNRYDPLSERFEHYFHDPEDASSLSSNVVTKLILDDTGVLWIGTSGGGLNRFDQEFNPVKFTSYQNDPDDASSLSSNTISALYEDHDGMLWVGTYGGGLNRLEDASGRFVRYQHNPEDPSSLVDDFIFSIVEDGLDKLWLGTSNGLALMDKGSGRFDTYQLNPDDPSSLNDNLINVLFIDQDGVLWVGTNNGGLNRMQGQTGQFVHYYPLSGDANSLGSNGVYSIYQDRGGVLWFGTFGGGVSRYSWTSEKFPHYRAVQGDRHSLNNDGVWTFFEDSQGYLWIGTTNGGLNRRDPATGEYAYYVNDPNDPLSLSGNFVMSVQEDRQGHFWVGTLGAGLQRFERDSGEFITYSTPLNVADLLEDSSGRLWIGTSQGLGRYNPQGDSFDYLLNDLGDPSSLSDNAITTLYEDHQGRLWVGTFSGGLNLFEPDKGSFTRYKHEPDDPTSLSADVVLSIHQDRNGTMWIGTTGGLDQFDPSTGTFGHYREVDGLPNNVIYGILEDEQGNLWLSTNRGLSKFNSQAKSFRNYTPADGLQSNEFNQGACYKDRQGRMYFGGISGFNAFFPEEIVDNPYVPPLVVTDLQLFNVSVVPGADSPLEKSISATDDINLTYKQDFLTFEFAALDYSSPERNRYAYIMERLEEDWNEVGTRRFAGYTSIPPGNYVFRVRGANNDGVWNEAGVSIRIAIEPPFWQTWWFRLLVAALLVGTVVGGFTLRLRIIQAQKKQLEVLVDERTQQLNETMLELRRSRDAAEAANRAKSVFLANISHELRTPLNAILGFSQLMLSSSAFQRKGMQMSTEQRENLEIINRSGEHLLGLINDVLEMSKIEAGRITLNEHGFDLQRLLEGLEDMFRLRAEDKGLSLDFEASPDVPHYILSDEGKLRQILMNLLGNAVKFTEAGGVVVRIDVRHPQEKREDRALILHIEIEDSGPGIAPEEMESIFEPFVQSESGRQSQEGTGLGLSISRQYAQLIGGELSVSSQVGEGSKFTLEVPIQVVEAGSVQTADLKRRVVGLESDQPSYRILVVDDKEVNRQLITRLFAPLGFEVREAVNGQEALDIWEEWDPHLIWMDMRMPVMDGYEATRRIKATVRGQATVIIALTASALEEDRQIILSEGCDDYIRKPFREREIFTALEKHLGARFKYAEIEDEGAETPPIQGKFTPETVDQAELAWRLRDLPADWVVELQRAVRLGSLDSILSVIEIIQAEDLRLADALSGWAENFEHDKILTLIEKGKPPHEHTPGK